MPSAVIVRTRLPAALERVRLASVGDAAQGVPAHLTLLYPFVAPEALGAGVRRRIAGIVGDRQPFRYRLVGPATWPDTVYAAVEPPEPFVRLQADLQAGFPEWPIYGPDFDRPFVPHVTIAEGSPEALRGAAGDPAWRGLPVSRFARSVEVIATGPDDRWRTVWRVPLGGPGRG